MKIAIILTLLIPVFCISQQPAKPVVQNNVNTLTIDMLNADLPFINEKIKKTNEQIKSMKDELIALRNEHNAISSQKQKLQFEINQLENKTNRSQQENAQVQQSKTGIKNIDQRIEKINQQIKELSDEVSQLEIDLQIMEEKMKELELKEKNQQKKDGQSFNDLKNDPVRLYARVKIFLDSLPASEKAKLNATENKTLVYFSNLYNSNANFQAAVSKESKINFLTAGAEDSKDNSDLQKTNYSEMLMKLKSYLQMLAAHEGKTQF